MQVRRFCLVLMRLKSRNLLKKRILEETCMFIPCGRMDTILLKRLCGQRRREGMSILPLATIHHL